MSGEIFTIFIAVIIIIIILLILIQAKCRVDRNVRRVVEQDEFCCPDNGDFMVEDVPGHCDMKYMINPLETMVAAAPEAHSASTPHQSSKCALAKVGAGPGVEPADGAESVNRKPVPPRRKKIIFNDDCKNEDYYNSCVTNYDAKALHILYSDIMGLPIYEPPSPTGTVYFGTNGYIYKNAL